MAKDQTIKLTRRQAAQFRQRRRRLLTVLAWGAVGVGILALAGWLIRQNTQPEVGEIIPVPANYVTHIEPGTPPGPYPTDPPAGGVHYGTELDAGFYEETDVAVLSQYPEGSLVHNLEHGYVIFWYNCAAPSQADCDALKTSIREVMDEFDGLKLIAFPWKSLDVPLVMTSWGRLLRFESFERAQARAFIQANRNHAPEPNAP